MLGYKYSEYQFGDAESMESLTEAGLTYLKSETRKFVERVDNIILLLNSNIVSLKFQFFLEKEHTATITRCILFAITKNVRKFGLDLRFFDHLVFGHGTEKLDRERLYVFPCSIFEDNCLEKLSLSSCIWLPPLNLKGFGSLAQLKLNLIFIDDASLLNALYNCPYLEQLVLVDCWGIVNLIVGPSMCCNLKYLRIDRCCSIKKVEISAVHLITFEYMSYPVDFSFFRTSRLVQFMLDFLPTSFYDDDRSKNALCVLSKDIPKLESLHLRLYLFDPENHGGFRQLPMFSNLRHLVLQAEVEESLGVFIPFLTAFPNVVKLEIHILQMKSQNVTILPSEISRGITYYNLKDVIITNVTDFGHIEFAKYLICNSPNLISITLSNEYRCYKRMSKYRLSNEGTDYYSKAYRAKIHNFFIIARQQLERVMPLGSNLSFMEI